MFWRNDTEMYDDVEGTYKVINVENSVDILKLL